MSKPSRPCRVRGKEYPSAAAAAADLGLAVGSIHNAIRLGRSDTVGLIAGGAKPYPVKVRGKEYPSAKAAADDLKVTVFAIYHAINLGYEDRVGTRPKKLKAPRYTKPFVMGRFSAPSRKVASLMLGMHPQYVSKVYDPNSRENMAGLVRRVMEYLAKQEAKEAKDRQAIMEADLPKRRRGTKAKEE